MCTFFKSTYSQELVISGGGKSRITVIIPSNPTPVEQGAAQVLKNNFNKTLGINVTIYTVETEKKINKDLTVYIGDFRKDNIDNSTTARLSETKAGGFTLSIKNRNVIIGGLKENNAVLNGVYYFFERFFDCRFFAKNDVLIPVKSKILLPNNFSIVVNPSFSYRALHFPEMYSSSYRDWNKVSFRDDIFGSVGNYTTHTLSALLPKELFKTHPEYFALHNRKRTSDHPCLSNPAVYDIVKANLEKSISQQASKKYWSVSQPDNNSYCECDLCRKTYKQFDGNVQSIILPFVNKLAENFPDKIISTLAYSYSLKPPKGISLRKNVNIMVCNYNLNRDLKLSHAEGLVEFESYVAGWSKLTNNLIIWDYVVQFTNFLSPYPNYYDFTRNLKLYSKYNILGVYAQGSGNNPSDFDELKSYLIAKKLWDINADESEIINEFSNSFYGKAAPEIINYLNSLTYDFDKSNKNLRMMGTPLDGRDSYLSYNKLIEYEKIIKKGLDKVSSQKMYADRVKKVLIGIQYAILQIERENYMSLKKGKTIDRAFSSRFRNINNLASDEQIRSRLDEFSENCKSVGVKYINNSRRSLETYQTYFN